MSPQSLHSYDDRQKFQTIFTEEIEGELISALPGQSTGEKKLKTDILEVVFMTRSWARIKEFSPDLLRKGLGSVKQLCSLLKTNGGVTDGEDPVTWLRGELYEPMTMFPISWDMREANTSGF
jgi:hypothetical protein